jgi:hypothetical protein
MSRARMIVTKEEAKARGRRAMPARARLRTVREARMVRRMRSHRVQALQETEAVTIVP